MGPGPHPPMPLPKGRARAHGVLFSKQCGAQRAYQVPRQLRSSGGDTKIMQVLPLRCCSESSYSCALSFPRNGVHALTSTQPAERRCTRAPVAVPAEGVPRGLTAQSSLGTGLQPGLYPEEEWPRVFTTVLGGVEVGCALEVLHPAMHLVKQPAGGDANADRGHPNPAAKRR